MCLSLILVPAFGYAYAFMSTGPGLVLGSWKAQRAVNLQPCPTGLNDRTGTDLFHHHCPLPWLPRCHPIIAPSSILIEFT